MSELTPGTGEAMTTSTEVIKTTLTLTTEQLDYLNNEIERELKLVEKMRAYLKAARELAHIDDEHIGDIFHINETADKVEEDLPTDNILLLEPGAILSVQGQFGINHPAFTDWDGYFQVDAIDMNTKKIVINGYGERHPEYTESPISKYSFIADSRVPLQDVEVFIVKDETKEVEDSEVSKALIDSLREPAS